MIGKLSGLTMNRDGSQNITVTVNADFSEEYDELADKDIEIMIKKFSKRRSLDANAYCWSLIDRIAEKQNLKKSEVYRSAIRDIGGVSTVICVKEEAAETLCNNWQRHGTGWQTEVIPSKIPNCVNVTLWYGSSVYDSKQMASLIDSLVQDAEAIGIPTITEKERQQLLTMWGRKQEKKQETAA